VLDELTVKDFGIIAGLTWRPAAGLNVITGETGAGKSLVVDAVEALLTGRINAEDIRHGADEARVEGVFSLAPEKEGTTLPAMLADKGFDTGEDSLIISCSFPRRGRAAPRLNHQAVSRAVLREIGGALVDIHGQSQHLSLLRREQHLDFLDAYARTQEARRRFGALASELHQVERQLEALSRDERELARREELLTFQVEEINRADLRQGEEEELGQEVARLAAAEKLKAVAYEVYAIIYGDDSAGAAASAVDRINQALAALGQMAGADPSLQTQLTNLEGVLHGLEELAREVRAYGEDLSDDPQRLEEVQGRLELIRTLKRKYGGSVAGVLAYLQNAQKELAGLTSSEERRAELEARREALRQEMGKLAGELTARRRQAGEDLAAAVKRELADLAMAGVAFGVSVTQPPDPAGIPLPDGQSYHYSASGIDEVVFMAATNPGEPPKPLDKIASTGEISRFLLALKSALAGADTVPVLIFDEIDIGVGGRSGEVIGRKLYNLSRHHQVICVTHLAPIAAFADAHFNVSKAAAGERTVSTIAAVTGEARLRELAAMLGGPAPTASTLTAAGELMEKAAAWKDGRA